jgi:hypothetical protein
VRGGGRGALTALNGGYMAFSMGQANMHFDSFMKGGPDRHMARKEVRGQNV